jgi:TetR/AcrR family tetracycline transcriptional repressor
MAGNEERVERGALDRERVVRVALELLDEVGLDDLSMRRLAERLGVTAASLYWYVRDKSELMDLLADAISAEVPLPDTSLPWRAQLETGARALRQLARAHRDTARILAGTTPTGSNRLRAIDALLGVLRGAGFSPAEAADAAYLFNVYVVGFLLDEALGPQRGSAPAQHEAPPRGSLTQARLLIERGGVDLTLRADPALNTLYQMTFDGRPPGVGTEDGVVRIVRRHSPRGALGLTLASGVRWEIVIDGGALRLNADLRRLRLASLDLVGGVNQAALRLPHPSGAISLRISADANRLSIERPPTAAIHARLNRGGSHVTLDGVRLGSVGNGTDLESLNYATATDRYDLVIGGAAAHLTLFTTPPGPDDATVDYSSPQLQMDSWLPVLSPQEYPNLTALAAYMAQPDTDRRFEVGLQILLDGLERRLAAAKERRHS